MKMKKNANDVHLQCQRIVASLILYCIQYFHCISVGKMRQFVDASSVRLGQLVKCVLCPPDSRPPRKNRRHRATG